MHGQAPETFARKRIRLLAVGATACLSVGFVVLATMAQELSAPPVPAPLDQRSAVSDDQVEVLTRGPVHEAFAEPLSAEPQPSLIVPKKPPEEIDEVAPDFKPEGDDVTWIPGYWAWDDDRDDFLWISGIWRKLPPGQRWIPGYWMETAGSWQWIAGLWAPDQQEELVYREAPPQSLEAGPNTPAPSDSHFWVPGCWMWYDVGYRWRPGYWHPYQAEWVWVPAHWIWTPNGCLFVAGYWDYRVSSRGQLFAPVYFRNTGWVHTHYYSPTCVVDSTPLLIHFWVRPRYCHYYFGDYYGPRYATWGLSPWSHSHSHRGHWDPLLAHYQVHYRHHDHIDYADRMRHWHSYYESHEDKRPRHTFRDQDHFAHAHPEKSSVGVQQAVLAAPLAAVAKKTDNVVPLKPVNQDRKKAFFDESRQIRELTRERHHTESFAKVDQPRIGADDLKNPSRSESDGRNRTRADEKGRTEIGDQDKVKTPDAGKPKEQTRNTVIADPTRDDTKGRDAKKENDREDKDSRPTRGGTLKLPKVATTAPQKSTQQSPAVPSQFGASKTDQPRIGGTNRGLGSAPGIPLNEQRVRGSDKSDRTPARSADDDKGRTKSPRDNNADGQSGKSQPRIDTPAQPKNNVSRPPTIEQPRPATPQPPKGPRVEQPKPEAPKQPRVEQPKPQQPRIEQPKPRVEPPKVEQPKPKAESPRSPRVEQPKPEPPKQPRTEQPKPPRVEQPKPPKAEAPKRSSSESSSRRSESKRSSDDRKSKSDRK